MGLSKLKKYGVSFKEMSRTFLSAKLQEEYSHAVVAVNSYGRSFCMYCADGSGYVHAPISDKALGLKAGQKVAIEDIEEIDYIRPKSGKETEDTIMTRYDCQSKVERERAPRGLNGLSKVVAKLVTTEPNSAGPNSVEPQTEVPVKEVAEEENVPLKEGTEVPQTGEAVLPDTGF